MARYVAPNPSYSPTSFCHVTSQSHVGPRAVEAPGAMLSLSCDPMTPVADRITVDPTQCGGRPLSQWVTATLGAARTPVRDLGLQRAADAEIF